MYSATDEVVALAAEAAAAGGLYASHIRGEGEHLFRAVDEAIEIGRGAEVAVHVSHLKCESSLVWGRASDLLARLRDADDATGDQYPYAAWNSSLASLLPPWAPVGELQRLVRDTAARDRLRRAVEEGEPDFQSSVRGVGWDRIVVVGTRDDRWRGLDIVSIAEEMGFEPFAACIRLLVEDADTSCIGHAMHDDDVRTILADPEVFVASDGSADAPDGPGGELPVHPREYGTFPRALALARDQGLLPVEAMVRKMTSLPADRFGLAGRGRIAEGVFADLVVLDAGEVRDTATYDTPHRYAEGVSVVVVNGEIAWEAGAPTITRSGGVLRR
jgi:N-acyl-D-aspartate/D-glutamate deacylase